MANAYLIATEYRGGPSPGDSPNTSITEKTSVNHGVGALVTAIKREHFGPGSIDKLVIVAEGKKGAMLLGMGLSVSNVKSLQPLASFLTPGKTRVGVELIGFKAIDTATKDFALAVANLMGVSVKVGDETVAPRHGL